jgi:hypothetical protein
MSHLGLLRLLGVHNDAVGTLVNNYNLLALSPTEILNMLDSHSHFATIYKNVQNTQDFILNIFGLILFISLSLFSI